jgi:hypothetical protein
LKIKKDRNTHLSKVLSFIKVKYNHQEEIRNNTLLEAYKTSLISEIYKKNNHLKLFKLGKDPLVGMKETLIWIKHGKISPRIEVLAAWQDRNIFLEKAITCPHCKENFKSVDQWFSSFFLLRHTRNLLKAIIFIQH